MASSLSAMSTLLTRPTVGLPNIVAKPGANMHVSSVQSCTSTMTSASAVVKPPGTGVPVPGAQAGSR